jgi:sugar phosphate isomerase/epimerase
MLDTSPPDLVSLAASTGFDAVGLRVMAAGEEPWPMAPGSPMLADTRRRLEDTGVLVNDVELVVFRPDTDIASYDPLLEVGALLGASFVNTIAVDTEAGRVRDNLAALTEAALPLGMRPVLEPMVFLGVRTLSDAVAVVDGTGAGVLADPLHLRRSGGSPTDPRTVDPALLPYYQLCDAPLDPPREVSRGTPLARGQAMDVPDLQFESRGLRLLPGEGELRLAAFVAAMPAGIPVSVEAPNVSLVRRIGPEAFARRAHQDLVEVLRKAENVTAS